MKNFNDAEFCAILEANGYKRVLTPHAAYYSEFVHTIRKDNISWARTHTRICYCAQDGENCAVSLNNWQKLESFIGEMFVTPESFNFGEGLENLGFIKSSAAFYSPSVFFPNIVHMEHNDHPWGIVNSWAHIEPTPENLEHIKAALNALKKLK